MPNRLSERHIHTMNVSYCDGKRFTFGSVAFNRRMNERAAVHAEVVVRILICKMLTLCLLTKPKRSRWEMCCVLSDEKTFLLFYHLWMRQINNNSNEHACRQNLSCLRCFFFVILICHSDNSNSIFGVKEGFRFGSFFGCFCCLDILFLLFLIRIFGFIY